MHDRSHPRLRAYPMFSSEYCLLDSGLRYLTDATAVGSSNKSAKIYAVRDPQ